MKNLLRICVLASIVCCLHVGELSAQTRSKSSKAKTSAAKKNSRKASSKKSSQGRLPKYFTHLELKDDQRDEVFKIQADYKKQIEALAEKLADLKEEQQDALEDVLSRTQKTLYNKYVAGTMKVGDKNTKSNSQGTSRAKSKSSRSKKSKSKKD